MGRAQESARPSIRGPFRHFDRSGVSRAAEKSFTRAVKVRSAVHGRFLRSLRPVEMTARGEHPGEDERATIPAEPSAPYSLTYS